MVRMQNNPLVKKIIDFFASHLLSCVLFFFLFLLTVLGTIDQKYIGLYEAQKKYFESLFLIYKIGQVSIPLPGVYLLLVVLFLNTIVGTYKRIKFKPAKYGVYLIHFSMVLLFAGSFVTFKFSDDGQMTLQEGVSSSRFVSYHEWELVIVDTNQNEKKDIEFSYDLNFGKNLIGQSFSQADLPFSFEILELARHAIVQPKGPMFETKQMVVNGYFINPLKLEVENELNIPAILLKVIDKKMKSLTSDKIIISGATPKQNSFVLNYDNKKWIILLRKKSWEIPFQITLDRVERDLYPGTMQAKEYRSFIRKNENEMEEKHEIYMNHPYRYKGYIFFQSGYTEDPNTNIKYSTFAVVQNPTDHVPLIACILISLGLTIHFLISLINFLEKESNK